MAEARHLKCRKCGFESHSPHFKAPVTQLDQSVGLLSRMSQVRVLPGVFNKRGVLMNMWNPDPVRLCDNKWWFYNETWRDWGGGPYDTEEDCRVGLEEYANYLNDEN